MHRCVFPTESTLKGPFQFFFSFFILSARPFDLTTLRDTPPPLCVTCSRSILPLLSGDLNWGFFFRHLPGASYQPEQNDGSTNIPSIHRHCLVKCSQQGQSTHAPRTAVKSLKPVFSVQIVPLRLTGSPGAGASVTTSLCISDHSDAL